MALGYSTTLRNAQLDAITTAAGSGAKIAIYDGTRPATGGTATTKLAEFTMSAALAPAASSAVLTCNLPPNTTGIAAGTATWYRITTSGGTFVMDGSAGTAGTDMILNTATISVSVTCSITAHTISCANA